MEVAWQGASITLVSQACVCSINTHSHIHSRRCEATVTLGTDAAADTCQLDSAAGEAILPPDI